MEQNADELGIIHTEEPQGDFDLKKKQAASPRERAATFDLKNAGQENVE